MPRTLPLATLYLTERCNSRCVTCDYWQHGRADISLEAVKGLLPELRALQTRVVLISGGEPLIHPEWPDIAWLLKSEGLKLWLLTSGLSLAKHAKRVRELFDTVTVSLDGTTPASYRAIRGLDAFEAVCDGIRAMASRAPSAHPAIPVNLRITVQRANYLELPQFVPLARTLGASGVSFLAADLGNVSAFGRAPATPIAQDIALRAEDLPKLAAMLDWMEHVQASDFASRFIAESPGKLRRRIYEYYRAVCGLGPYPSVRCNAPEFSAVIEARGAVRPCFFIEGPGLNINAENLGGILESSAMSELRADIRQRKRPECQTCVCSMWREESAFDLA